MNLDYLQFIEKPFQEISKLLSYYIIYLFGIKLGKMNIWDMIDRKNSLCKLLAGIGLFVIGSWLAFVFRGLGFNQKVAFTRLFVGFPISIGIMLICNVIFDRTYSSMKYISIYSIEIYLIHTDILHVDIMESYIGKQVLDNLLELISNKIIILILISIIYIAISIMVGTLENRSKIIKFIFHPSKVIFANK